MKKLLPLLAVLIVFFVSTTTANATTTSYGGYSTSVSLPTSVGGNYAYPRRSTDASLDIVIPAADYAEPQGYYNFTYLFVKASVNGASGQKTNGSSFSITNATTTNGWTRFKFDPEGGTLKYFTVYNSANSWEGYSLGSGSTETTTDCAWGGQCGKYVPQMGYTITGDANWTNVLPTTFTPFLPSGYTSTSTYTGINIGGIYDNGTTNGIEAVLTSTDGDYHMNYFLPVVNATVGNPIYGTEVEIGDDIVEYPVYNLPNSDYELYYYAYDMLTGTVDGDVLASTTFSLSQESNPNVEYPPSVYAPTGTSTDLTVTCDPNSGFFENSFCNMFVYLFKPSDGVFNSYNGLWEMVSAKPPLGYFTKAKEALEAINNEESVTFTFEDVSALDDNIFTPLRDGVAWLLWAMFGIWIFNRMRHMQF